MLSSTRNLIYVDLNEGIGKNSNKPYRIIKLADPTTFENFQLSADPEFKMQPIKKGEQVNIEAELSTVFNNTRITVTDIYPAPTN